MRFTETAETTMAKRKIKRRSGEGISISGPATVYVSRGVMLVVDAPKEARVARLGKRRASCQDPRSLVRDTHDL